MKSNKKTIIWIILIIIASILSFFIGKKVGMNTDSVSSSTKVEDVTVGIQTIKKTLSSSGEITTPETKKISLNTSYYYSKINFEVGDIVKKGEVILEYTNGKKLKAPYDCVISNVNLPSKKTKVTSSNYVEIKNISSLIVSINVSENEIKNITLGTEVEIVLSSDSTKKYTGKVSKINSIGTYSMSGTTYLVEVSIKNDGNIKLGMSVNCTINISEQKDVIAVPIEAVQIYKDRRYVVLVTNDETKEVDVETGSSDDTYVEITKGLEEGQKVRVTTVTKQSTIRNTSSNGFGGMNGGFNPNSSNRPNGNYPNRPGSNNPGGNR